MIYQVLKNALRGDSSRYRMEAGSANLGNSLPSGIYFGPCPLKPSSCELLVVNTNGAVLRSQFKTSWLRRCGTGTPLYNPSALFCQNQARRYPLKVDEFFMVVIYGVDAFNRAGRWGRGELSVVSRYTD